MKRTESKKLIYEVPVTHIKDGSVNTNVLAGSEHTTGLEMQGEKYTQNTQNLKTPIVDDPGEVLAKPHNFFWEMSEDE